MYNRDLLKKVYNDTIEYALDISKTNILLPSKKLKHTKLNIIDKYKKKFNTTNIQVFNEDVIKSTIYLYNKLQNDILVLNLASKKQFGGGVMNGAMAQEEELFRKTSYGLHYGKELYPLKLNEFVFTPKVFVLKDENYNRLNIKNIFTVDMLAISAIYKPQQINGKLNESDYDLTLKKIETIFKYAIYNHNINLILGALGCGVFQNPPNEIIEIFNKCIKKYNGYFNNIIFSIKSTNDNNFELFNKYIIRHV